MEIVKSVKDEEEKIAAIANYSLTPTETMVVINWVYEKDLRTALTRSNLTPMWWDMLEESRQKEIKDLVDFINADMLANAWELMKDATLQAVATMTSLLKSDDDNVRARAAQFILEQQFGKAKTIAETKNEVTINLKGYAVGVTPEDWDAPRLTDGEEDVVDGAWEDADL